MIGIIGATGQIGRELCKRLLSNTVEFCGLVRDLARAQNSLGTQIRLRHFDHVDPNTFDSSLTGLSMLFLVTDRGINLEQLLKHAERHGIEFIVFMSGLGAELRPHNTLRQAELTLAASSIKFCSLRANWFMQNFSGMFLNDIKGNLLKLPADDGKISFIDARDIADASLELFKQPPPASAYYNLTGLKAYSHSEIAVLISEARGTPLVYQSISDNQAKAYYSWDDEVIALFSDIRHGRTALVSKDLELLLKTSPRTLEDFILENRPIWT